MIYENGIPRCDCYSPALTVEVHLHGEKPFPPHRPRKAPTPGLNYAVIWRSPNRPGVPWRYYDTPETQWLSEREAWRRCGYLEGLSENRLVAKANNAFDVLPQSIPLWEKNDWEKIIRRANRTPETTHERIRETRRNLGTSAPQRDDFGRRNLPI